MNEILQQRGGLLLEMQRLTKMNKNNKFKMASAAILNLIYRSKLVYYCTYLHEIWHVKNFAMFSSKFFLVAAFEIRCHS